MTQSFSILSALFIHRHCGRMTLFSIRRSSHTPQHVRTLVLFLLLGAVMLSPIFAQTTSPVDVSTEPSSRHLIEGEIAFLEYRFEGLNTFPQPTQINHPDTDIIFKTAAAHRDKGKPVYFLFYQLVAPKKERLIIPEIKFRTRMGLVTAPAATITIHPESALTEHQLEEKGQTVTYYTLIKGSKTNIYPNECIPVDYKIYFPNRIKVDLWGLPKGEKLNCTAWRFQTPNRELAIGKARINNKTYQAANYSTNLTAGKTGKASLGPFKTRLICIKTVFTPYGPKRQVAELFPISNELALNILEFPPNRPPSFQGDVGTYTLEALIEAPDTITENDSFQIIVQINGTGNRAILNAPKLTHKKGWKVINISKTELEEDRKSITGIAEFIYTIQPDPSQLTPTNKPTHTPEIEFCYLDPELVLYNSINIPGKPIKINISATDSSTQELQLGPAELITNLTAYKNAWYHPFQQLPIQLIYILPGLLFATMASKKILALRTARNIATLESRQRKNALKKLTHTKEHFLKAAGSYIEQWVNTDKHPKAKEILKLRDQVCFRPNEPEPISNERREKILNILRSMGMMIFLIFALSTTHSLANTKSISDFSATANTAQQAYDSQEFQLAIEHYLTLLAPEGKESKSKKPDILFNIGLCYSKLGDDGQAALYYHRVLLIRPTHSAALKNLQILEEKNNTLDTKNLSDLEHSISRLHSSTYRHLIYFSIATLAALLLYLFTGKPRHRNIKLPYRLTVAGLLILPFILILSIIALFNHPFRDHDHLAPYLISKEAPLTKTPVKQGQVITNVSVTRRCRLIANRGKYSYIQLSHGTKGWIKSENITAIK